MPGCAQHTKKRIFANGGAIATYEDYFVLSPALRDENVPGVYVAIPTVTPVQATLRFQVAQSEFWKVLPVERPVHHWPFCKTRPVMSALPSPLKSPTCTSTQVT